TGIAGCPGRSAGGNGCGSHRGLARTICVRLYAGLELVAMGDRRRVWNRRGASWRTPGLGRCPEYATAGFLESGRMSTGLEVRQVDIPGGAMLYDARRVARPEASLFDPAAAETRAQSVSHGGRRA